MSFRRLTPRSVSEYSTFAVRPQSRLLTRPLDSSRRTVSGTSGNHLVPARLSTVVL